MFSGIIQEMGQVKQVKERRQVKTFTVQVKKVLKGLQKGDSVSVNGACMTVIRQNKASFVFEVMPETLGVTNFSALKIGSLVNLEDSLRIGDKLSGHFVSGHVDSVVKVKKVSEKGDSKRIYFSLPKKCAKYVKRKGSVALNGVSLTVSEKKGAQFSVDLIPFTLKETNFKKIAKGDMVNLEVDVLARYVLD
ncbi:riboflavin synthase [Patescibacteria group bacterium]|nr:riboflavin synthase [Patescibacteria group bacterium]